MRALRRFLSSVFLFFASVHLSVSRVLVDFQVAQPPPVPKDTSQCTIEILQHDFANSFGHPAIVEYTPPENCGPAGSWAAITLNFTVTSNGTQFDRLGTFTFQNVEIWRTSTPEPTRGDGIIWTYVKDVSRYMPLFKEKGLFILQLDNLIETGLTGVYSTVLQATFFASSSIHPPAEQSDLIIPIASLSNSTGAQVSVPPTFSSNVTIPRNAVQIYAELYASGNGNEEFWYFNTVNKFLSKLPPNTSFGGGPFREVRLLVDGQVAGVAYPYATIFTGGIIPTAWRPITSYGALDLPTYFLDITPFVPILTDGETHVISLDVVSAENDHTINQNWFLSAVLQVFIDKNSSNPTTGEITQYSGDFFSKTNTVGSVGENGDLNVTVSATRQLHIESTIISGSGIVNNVVWDQNLVYNNEQNYQNINGSNQVVRQTASGIISSTHNGAIVVFDNFIFPLVVDETVSADGDVLQAVIDHSYNRDLLPLPIVVRSNIEMHQKAGGIIVSSLDGTTGNGTSNNTFSYTDEAGNTFTSVDDAAFNVITIDQEGGTLAPTQAADAKKAQESIAPSFLDNGFGSVRLPGGRQIGVGIDIDI